MGSFAGQVTVSVQGEYSKALDGRDVKDTVAYTYNKVFTPGAGANQANTFFMDSRTIDGSGNESLDLNGTLTDAFGETVDLTECRTLLIVAASTNVGNLEIGGAASNGAASFFDDPSDIAIVPPGGCYLAVAPGAAGFAITAGTADLLKITNAGGSAASYTVIVIGSDS